MANANISLVTLSKTFDEWRVATNDLISDRNILRNSNYVKDDGDLSVANGKIQISRAAGGTTFTNDNDALIGGLLTTTDLTIVDDIIVGANGSMISANARLTVNNNVYTRNLESNNLITAANVSSNGYLIVGGQYRDSQNNILNVNSVLYMSNSGAINTNSTFSANGQITANKATGTGLYVVANTVLAGNLSVTSNTLLSGNLSVASNTSVSGNLSVSDNATVSKNVNVTNWTNTGNLLVSLQSTLTSANVVSANILTANIATLNVNAAGAIANVANLRVANSNTVNAYIKTLVIGDPIATLNAATLNVSTLMNVVAANITTLEVTSLSVKDPITAPSESDSASYRLRVAQSTAGDGFFGVYQGSAQRGNAWINFDSASSTWRLTSNSTQGIYSTILTTGNIVTTVTSTSTTDVGSASAVKSAYDHANAARTTANTALINASNAYDTANNAGSSATVQAAYAAANSAANTARVSANSGSTLTARQLNFVNTSTVTVSVTSAPDGNANIQFTSSGSSPADAYNTANNAANTVAVYANNTLVYANSNVNFNNTATVNVSVTQNTTNKRANIEFTANLTAIGIPAITSAFGTVNTNITTANTQANSARDTGNNAYAQANSAANTARVSANGGSTLTSRQLNFVNTSTVTVSVTANPDGSNANISFTAASSTSAAGSNKQVQFNNSGVLGGATDIVYDSATKRVGIGATSPASKLHITNTLSGAQSLKALVKVHDMWNEGVNGQFFQILGGTDGINLLANYGNLVLGAREDGTDTHTANIVIQRTTGNVGIGVSSPRSNLEIKSTQGSVGFNYGTLSSPVRGNMFYDTDGSGWQFQIGKLQSGTFTGQMTFADNGEITIPNSLTVANAYSQNVQIAGVSQAGTLTIDGVSVRSASILTSGTVATARLGSGTANSVTYLAGDSTYKPINNFLRQASAGYVGGNVFISSTQPTAGAVGDIWIEI